MEVAVWLAVATLFVVVNTQEEGTSSSAKLKDFFVNCHPGNEDFDECVRKGINSARILFPYGAPEYDIPPFDPFYAKEVLHKRSGPLMRYKLRLSNVVESGWTLSTVTRFKSDLANEKITYEQTFPDKVVAGDYEIEGSIVPMRFHNKGIFNVSLYDYTQTTTITRRRRDNEVDGAFPLSVRIVNTSVRDMKLNISNLAGGNAILENLAGNLINRTWRPFFPLFKSAIDDMVSSAFTLIFSRAFENFPFDEVFTPSQSR